MISAMPDLDAATQTVAVARDVVDMATRHLAEIAGARADPSRMPENQTVVYDLAHAAAGVEIAESAVKYGGRGDLEARIACAFVADAVHDFARRLLGRERVWGVDDDALAGTVPFLRTYRDPSFLRDLADQAGPRHLDADFELVQDTFRRFADDRVRPVADHVHRTNGDIPDEIITGLAELGTFGLSVPEEYGGFSAGGEAEYLGMVIATEELSRASLGVAGSLITRPEILTRALIQGGTESQKQTWLPKVASGDVMVAVAVTEPDYGSDSGAVATAADRVEGGYVITGVKTWCTFAARADVFSLLARTDPDRTKAHRGLSLFIVPKPRGEGHSFAFTQDGGGRIEGRAIDTIGYRGMHSYEVVLDRWFVPAANLVGGDDGVGRGFYLQMQGFENGRLQTAARAIGVMQAAYEAALDYASNRIVFGRPVIDYELVRVKLARMAVIIQAARQFMYDVARLMARGTGTMEASMIKAYVCRAAEWVTREALQIHGGMGYAEEFPVSRYYVDARVLSIFEGADEILALNVIAKRLLRRTGDT
jgi:(2S)-methylsuccinyl-CoA dehydrogenase